MKKSVIVAGLLAATFAITPAKADKLDDIISSGTLRCAVVLDFPPMGARDDANNPIGFDVDYCNDLAKAHLSEVLKLVEPVAESDWNAESVKAAVWPYAESAGRGNVLWPTRFALSGRDKSPDPFALAAILGKEETISRINHAISLI